MTGTDQNGYIYLFYGDESTLRYYWTYTYFTDTRVPVGTTEQIRYGQNLIKCRSTRRYYKTDQIQEELIQIRDLSDAGVPVGTTEPIIYRT